MGGELLDWSDIDNDSQNGCVICLHVSKSFTGFFDGLS